MSRADRRGARSAALDARGRGSRRTAADFRAIAADAVRGDVDVVVGHATHVLRGRLEAQQLLVLENIFEARRADALGPLGLGAGGGGTGPGA